MIEGKVKWYNSEKGYGFIVSEGVDRDIFFHFSQISKNPSGEEPKTGDHVEFKMTIASKGVQAQEIVVNGR